jgi:hypothetical protein
VKTAVRSAVVFLTLCVAFCVGGGAIGASARAAATGPSYSTVPIAPTSVIHTQSAPDARGGISSQTIITWVTRFSVTKPNAAHQVFQNGPVLAATGDIYGHPPGGCSNGANGYTSRYDFWEYRLGPLVYVWTQIFTQDAWNCINATIHNEFVDPECGSNVPNSACNSFSTGSHQGVSCGSTPVVYGTCDYDWGNFNVTIAGGDHWDYLRAWADTYGNYTTTNSNP